MNVTTNLIVCYVIRRDSGFDEVLQLRRSGTAYLGGTWQAVNGRIEAGETAWQAAIRELREETGLRPIDFYRLPVVNTFYIFQTDTLCHSVPFCAIVDSSAPVRLNAEHDQFRWIARNQIDDSFMWATDRQALREMCNSVLDDGPAKPYLRVRLPE